MTVWMLPLWKFIQGMHVTWQIDKKKRHIFLLISLSFRHVTGKRTTSANRDDMRYILKSH